MPRAGRQLHKLPRDAAAQLTAAGIYSDGGNLYLRVRDNAAPAWVFQYVAPGGRQRTMTLGNARDMPLGRARDLAREAREKLDAGIDPLEARDQARTNARTAHATAAREAARESATLAREARRLHELVSPTFKNDKHAAQWINSLEQHVPAQLWHMPIADAAQKPGAFLEFLQPLYVKLPETGSRVRGRLDHVFDDAMMRGLCTANPPAAIKKTLTKLAGKRRKGSFAALAWAKVPGFLKRLRALDGISPRMLEFTLLTVARTGEVLGMEWAEVDLRTSIWTVPAHRMKGAEPHIVYLTPRACEILEEMRGLGVRYVFPSPQRENAPMSNMAMLELLKDMGLSDQTTVHGLRATFSTWANERGHYRPDVIEACLAHKEADRVRAAYNRAQFLAERRQLLADWAAFTGGGKQARVSSLAAARRKKTG